MNHEWHHTTNAEGYDVHVLKTNGHGTFVLYPCADNNIAVHHSIESTEGVNDPQVFWDDVSLEDAKRHVEAHVEASAAYLIAVRTYHRGPAAAKVAA